MDAIPLLLVHGNGGGNSRFARIRPQLDHSTSVAVRPVFPNLPGFEGRPLPEADDGWAPFLEALDRALPDRSGNWVLYGHGIGGSLLLEWAARGLPEGLQVRQVLLHAPIGASLQYRFFPKLMRPKPIRRLLHWLIYQPALQGLWERRLFSNPEQIPREFRRQFFQDYRHCAAFEPFFDLITPEWYQSVLRRLPPDLPVYFWWGADERVVAAKHLEHWQSDFPNAPVEIIPGWDHFPMLDHPEAFANRLLQHLAQL